MAAGGAAGVAVPGEGEGRTAPDLVALYTAHYRSLVRLAAFLCGDRDGAEEVVQDAYVRASTRWRGLRDPARAEAYLRQAVVNGARSRLRHDRVVEQKRPAPMPDGASAEEGAVGAWERGRVVAALQALPRRQREVVVLRYYGDLSEAQTADALGISRGAVKSHGSRAMSALRLALEELL